MALIVSATSGNFNVGGTWVGGVVPGVGDEAQAATGHVVTITANVTCTEISNAGTGKFIINSGVTLTANVTSKGTATCLEFTAASPAQAFVVGNVSGSTLATGIGITNSSSGTITITGNVISGTTTNVHGIINNSNGIVNVTGNVNPSASAAGNPTPNAIQNAATGTVNVTGTVTGGAGTGIGAGMRGIQNNSTGTVVVVGACVAGTGSGTTPSAVFNNSTGAITITGNCTATNQASAIQATSIAAIKVSGSMTSSPNGNVAVHTPRLLVDPTPSAATVRFAKNGTTTYSDFFTADTNLTQANPADVRFGTVYASGALTGTCYVPAAASVAFGVPVDNTTGTAALTPASVWDYALSSITTSSTIGKLLKDNVDATISSRSTATTAGIADAVWDELLDDHTTNGSFGARVVRSLNSNNTLQLTGSHHAAADVHEFQNEVIADYAFAPSAVTLFTDAVRTELATELTAITELHLIHGLKNGSILTVTPTSRSAGSVSQTIGGDGTNSTTVSRD